MPWQCPQCGVEGLDDSLGSHAIEAGGCGYGKFPSRLTLSSEATGKSLTVRLTTTIGQLALRGLVPDEARFVSVEQFRVAPVPELGGWQRAAVSSATNPTYLNDVPVTAEGALLKDGDCVSVKHKMRLTVRLLE